MSPSTPGSTDITRRQLLAAAGGVSLAVLLHAPPARARGAEGGADGARLATLTALLAAMGCGPAAGMTPELAAVYVERYSAHMDAADPFLRAYAEAALDDLDRTGIAGREPAAAYAQLEAWARDGRHATRAAAALDLTNLPFDDDEARQAGYALVRS